MIVSKYKEKRNLRKTPEPESGVPKEKKLKFVVQKHAASHLHYDFRLEMGGVLKSWAIPKGPSMNPQIKRLAIMVEDHPYDYSTFEGSIPEGNYGAGTVMVWDEGWYEAFEETSKDKKLQDKELQHQLYNGKIKFILHGKKLKGMFALIKTPIRGENNWLLTKLKDKNISTEDILLKDKSVLSKKNIDQIKENSRAIVRQNLAKSIQVKISARNSAAKKK